MLAIMGNRYFVAAMAAICFGSGVPRTVGAVESASPELVLQEQVRLTAQTAGGRITIVAGSGIARAYKWGDCSLQAHMLTRSARWFGSMGIYDPAPASLGTSSTRQCEGISRTVVEEGQLHFVDDAVAREWLGRYSKTHATAWTSDGLVVRWGVVPRREQLNVEVWQLCIAGHYPAQLPGAKAGAVQLDPSTGTGAGSGRRACAVVADTTALETQMAWQSLWESAEQIKAKDRGKRTGGS